MKRHPCKFGKCKWIPETKTVDRCSICGDVFPCDWECSHGDCEDKRGYPPNCYVCKKPVLIEDRFHCSGRRGWVAVHKIACSEKCVDESPEASVVISWKVEIGASVKLSEELDSVYRTQYGELVDELVVDKVVDRNRVIVRWIGMVPIAHLRGK